MGQRPFFVCVMVLHKTAQRRTRALVLKFTNIRVKVDTCHARVYVRMTHTPSHPHTRVSLIRNSELRCVQLRETTLSAHCENSARSRSSSSSVVKQLRHNRTNGECVGTAAARGQVEGIAIDTLSLANRSTRDSYPHAQHTFITSVLSTRGDKPHTQAHANCALASIFVQSTPPPAVPRSKTPLPNHKNTPTRLRSAGHHAQSIESKTCGCERS